MEEFNCMIPVEVHMRIDSPPADEEDDMQESQQDQVADINIGINPKTTPTPTCTSKTRRRSRRKKASSDYEKMECNLCLFETADGREALQVHYTDEHSKEDLAVTLIDIIYPEGADDELRESSNSKEKSPKRRASLYPCPVCAKNIVGKNNLEKHLIRHRCGSTKVKTKQKKKQNCSYHCLL